MTEHRPSAPTLVAITLTPNGDGVAVVARLLNQALQCRSNSRHHIVTMFEGAARRPTIWNKMAFATRLDRHVLLGKSPWLLFSHMNLIRAMRLLPKGFRRPYAVFLHGVEAWKPFGAADRALVQGAALRLANSQHTARRAMEANPDIGPVVACPLALPEMPGSDVRAAPAMPPPLSDSNVLAVLIVGGLRSEERYKGHDQLIEAWPAVVAAVPQARLVIVGDGDDRPRIQALVDQSGARHAISLLGFVSDEVLAACYARAALFAMPSRGEGFGLVYLEAMAHRVACIGSRQDAAGEIIQHGVTGLLVDQHDVPAIGSAIISLLSDADRRRAMGVAGQARVRKEFSLSAFQSRLAAAVDPVFPAEA